MAEQIMNFIDAGPKGPFEGCLVILNIGEDNYADASLGVPNSGPVMSPEYLLDVSHAIDEAHARGWLVIYAFDSRIGVSRSPIIFDTFEDMDCYMLLGGFSEMKDARFSLVPSARRAEMSMIMDGIWKYKNFSFSSREAKMCGMCEMGGQQVLMPPTKL